MMQRKCSVRACFIALGVLRAFLCLMQCRQGMTLWLPIRTTSYQSDSFSKYFNAHITVSKTFGWKLWLDINFHNMNQIKFLCSKRSSDVIHLFPVFFSKVRRTNSFTGKLANKQLLSWVFSKKILFLFSRLPEGNLPNTREKDIFFFWFKNVF